MRVKCIYNISTTGFIISNLTINKTYDIVNDYNSDFYIILNDVYKEWMYPKGLFKPLSEYRIEKINKLLK
jgi:hypothetical protein